VPLPAIAETLTGDQATTDRVARAELERLEGEIARAAWRAAHAQRLLVPIDEEETA
jgi:hypothetical protein